MRCYHSDRHDATHHIQIIYSGDERWSFETEYTDDYVCQSHIHDYIESHDEVGVTIHEVTVKELP